MTNTAAPIQGTAPISTTLDIGAANVAVGGGAPPPEAKEEPKRETPGDTMRAELARIREDEAKAADDAKAKGEDAAKDAKAKVDEAEKAEGEKKPEDKPKADDKAADKGNDKAKAEPEKATEEPARKAEASEAEKPATGQEADKPRQSEGSKRADPPARFLPKAKEAWINVPHSVRDEVHRMAEEHEAEVGKYKQATERYETIREFDEIAQKNGRQLRDSLTKVVQIEQALARNPVMGLEMILREIGPKRPDGSAVSLYEVAQFIAKQTPEQYRAALNGAFTQQQTQQRQQAQTSEVQQLRAEIQSIRAEQAAASILEPFKAAHPRYSELEEDIAFFLKSGKIPASLGPAERLAAAYDMAERINPVGSRSVSPALQDQSQAPVAAKPAAPDPDGSKSIRGAPTGGDDPDDDDAPDATDLKALLRREMRKRAS